MSLAWVSADLVTGRVLADLPGLYCDWPLRRTIGRYETATAHAHLSDLPPNWEWALREGGVVVAAYDEDDTDPLPAIQWAGIVTVQERDTTRDTIDLSLATGEAYLDRRYVRDVTYTQVPQTEIAADLARRFAVNRPDRPGLPYVLDYSTVGAPLRDRAYLDSDNATVYARLTQLMAITGGVEFTVDWSWSNSGQAIVPTLRLAQRIGRPKPTGFDVDAVFDLPGCLLSAAQLRDYSADKGANDVTAYAQGNGDDAPAAARVITADTQGRPTFEYRWSPSSSITVQTTLAQYARQAAALLAPGARPITMTAERSAAPRLGRDWQLGDDIGYVIGGLDDTSRETVPHFPGGISGYARAIAYELTETTISPIAAEVTVPTDAEATA